MINHRNVTKRHFCPGCDHFHELANPGMPAASGVCLLYPPTPFIVGMAAPAVVTEPTAGSHVPIVRGYYPPVGPGDTCAQWTPRAEGEA
jgi:hypothetical protein